MLIVVADGEAVTLFDNSGALGSMLVSAGHVEGGKGSMVGFGVLSGLACVIGVYFSSSSWREA